MESTTSTMVTVEEQSCAFRELVVVYTAPTERPFMARDLKQRTKGGMLRVYFDGPEKTSHGANLSAEHQARLMLLNAAAPPFPIVPEKKPCASGCSGCGHSSTSEPAFVYDVDSCAAQADQGGRKVSKLLLDVRAGDQARFPDETGCELIVSTQTCVFDISGRGLAVNKVIGCEGQEGLGILICTGCAHAIARLNGVAVGSLKMSPRYFETVVHAAIAMQHPASQMLQDATSYARRITSGASEATGKITSSEDTHGLRDYFYESVKRRSFTVCESAEEVTEENIEHGFDWTESKSRESVICVKGKCQPPVAVEYDAEKGIVQASKGHLDEVLVSVESSATIEECEKRTEGEVCAHPLVLAAIEELKVYFSQNASEESPGLQRALEVIDGGFQEQLRAIEEKDYEIVRLREKVHEVEQSKDALLSMIQATKAVIRAAVPYIAESIIQKRLKATEEAAHEAGQKCIRLSKRIKLLNAEARQTALEAKTNLLSRFDEDDLKLVELLRSMTVSVSPASGGAREDERDPGKFLWLTNEFTRARANGIPGLHSMTSALILDSIMKCGYVHEDTVCATMLMTSSVEFELHALNSKGTDAEFVKLAEVAHPASVQETIAFLAALAEHPIDEAVSLVIEGSVMLLDPSHSGIMKHIRSLPVSAAETFVSIYSGICDILGKTTRTFVAAGDTSETELLTAAHISAQANCMATKVAGCVIIYLLGCLTDDIASQIKKLACVRVIIVGTKDKMSEDRLSLIYKAIDRIRATNFESAIAFAEHAELFLQRNKRVFNFAWQTQESDGCVRFAVYQGEAVE